MPLNKIVNIKTQIYHICLLLNWYFNVP